MKPWYTIKALAPGSAEIWIYDIIGVDYWGDGVAAAELCKEIAALDVSQIDIHINSPGGNVFDGVAIQAALRRHRAHTTAYVDGYAASIAALIACGCDTVIMAAGAMMMIHCAWTILMGNATELRSAADILDKMDETQVATYAGKSGKSADEIRGAMVEETWFTAEEAVEYGLADELAEPIAAAASIRTFDFKAFGYKHVPEGVAAATPDDAADQLTSVEILRLRAAWAEQDGTSDEAGDSESDTTPTMERQRLAALLARAQW
jgi:ATP-dependent protease ClpP protease subunit